MIYNESRVVDIHPDNIFAGEKNLREQHFRLKDYLNVEEKREECMSLIY